MRGLAVPILVVTALASVASAGEGQAVKEAGEEWTLVDSLPIPAGTIPWQPSIALRGDTVYVVSNLVSEADGKPVPNRPVVLYRLPGTPLPLPPGDFSFAFARGFFDPEGSYHMFWGEGPNSGQSSIPGPNHNVATVWTAVFRAEAWSMPAVVLSSRNIRWTGEPATIAWDDHGRIHFAAPYTDSSRKSGVVHARRDSTGWSVHEIPDMVAAYVALLPERADTMSMAVSGGYAGFPSQFSNIQRNRLAILRSFDGGLSWSAPRLLEGLTPLEVYDLHGSVDRAGTLHLLWKGLSEESAVPRVERFLSRDGGSTWSVADSFAVDGMLHLHRLTVGPCGAQFVGSISTARYSHLLSRPMVSSRHLRERLSVHSPALTISGENAALSVLAIGPTEDDMSWLILRRSGCGVTGAM